MLGLLLLPMMSAAQKPKSIDVKNVQDVEFTLLQNDKTLIHGKVYRYDIRVTDVKQKVYSLRDGTLSPKDIHLESGQLATPATDQLITLSPDPVKFPQKKMQIDLSYGSGKAPIHRRFEFEADLAFVIGPEPED